MIFQILNITLLVIFFAGIFNIYNKSNSQTKAINNSLRSTTRSSLSSRKTKRKRYKIDGQRFYINIDARGKISKSLTNNSGNISFLGILLTLFLSAITVSFILVKDNTLKENKTRAKTYLCAKSFIKSTDKYIKKMATFNISIRALNVAEIAAKATGNIPAASGFNVAKKAVISLLKLYHISHMQNLLRLSHCSLSQRALLTKTPFKKLRARNKIEGTLPLRGKKWRFSIHSKDFLLTGTYYLNSSVSRAFKIKIKEIPVKGILKHFSGFSF